MNFTGPAILLASRTHGESAVIARLLTEEQGLIAAFVAGCLPAWRAYRKSVADGMTIRS